ncbi:MAG: T9SS type A sorting domain-containing protein [Saprospiraceae bacterium]
MKKLFLQLFVLLLTGVVAYGQIDTVSVPHIIDGDPFGAINKFILGDTTSTGERVNELRYYKLEKNKIYFLNGILHTDFDLRLIADDVEEGETPPIVASTTGSDGTIQLIQFKLFQNGYVKNIIFQMTPPSGNGESNASFFLAGENKNYEFDNVMIEWGLWTGIVTEKPVNKVVIKNCYFKNQQHKTNIWNGRGFGFFQENPADSVIMQNNTFFNNNSFVFFADISSIPPDYLLFDHNTIVNTMKFPIHSFWLPNAKVTNNLFYNAHSYGETEEDKVGQDPGGQQYGIINISAIPSDLIDYYNIEEGDRKYRVANNGFYYANPINIYWQQNGLQPTPFMNPRTMGMFADEAVYPNLKTEAPMVADPGFINQGEGMASMVQWMTNKRNIIGNTYWGWDSDDDKFGVEWPLVEDLSYTNEDMKVASQGGFPLGDLNWWGDAIKDEWNTWAANTTAVEDLHSTAIDAVTIAPNPANNILTINYILSDNSDLSINLFNLNGSRAAGIYNGHQSKGEHQIGWKIEESITNGIYLIRISDGNGSITKKVIIQK